LPVNGDRSIWACIGSITLAKMIGWRLNVALLVEAATDYVLRANVFLDPVSACRRLYVTARQRYYEQRSYDRQTPSHCNLTDTLPSRKKHILQCS
jgi:hypothetical protein